MARLFTATWWTGSSPHSPIPLGWEDFEIIRGGLPEDAATLQPRYLPQHTFRRLARERGWGVIESIAASAQPAGYVNRQVYEALRDEILSDLEAALPVDAVCLALLGAAVAWGYEDCEADMLRRIRALVGDGVAVGLMMNCHSHLTRTILENATAVVTFKEYPHTDHADRAVEVFRIIAATIDGQANPCMSCFDCRMIAHYYTDREPMRGFVDRAKSLEGRNGVLSISLVHGYIYGDAPEMGTKVLVITDGRPEFGQRLAERLGNEWFSMREFLLSNYTSVADALQRVLRGARQPVILAEGSDNPNSGDAGDSTIVIAALREHGITNIAASPVYDPIAVRLAAAAGEGAKMKLRVGGKISHVSGQPIDLVAEIVQIRSDVQQHVLNSGRISSMPMGLCVHLRTEDGIELIINDRRQQTFTTECFTSFGIDLLQKRALVVKSKVEYRRYFSSLAGEIIEINAAIPSSGSQRLLLQSWSHTRLQRPIWPLDEVQAPADLRASTDDGPI